MSDSCAAPIRSLDVHAYRIPTDQPESDGTFEWHATTMVVVHLEAGGQRGIGYTYADTATATLISDTLRDVVIGRDAMGVEGAWWAMAGAIRNLGRPGIASMAISAVDVALWDLKGKLLGVSVLGLLGAAREAVPIYGSGGFTSYDIPTLQQQLYGWVGMGIPRVKMKVGRDPDCDPERVRAARDAIGPGAQLFVDANGAYSRKQSLHLAQRYAEFDVSWFEEPVSSDDLDGLRLLRDRAPAGMDIAAGEYGYDVPYFRRMLASGSVDVLQADGSRCGGITGFRQAAAVAQGFSIPVSAHCAPSLHAQVCCACQDVRHIEYFHDHVRIEEELFDGVLQPNDGALRPDLSRPGLGLEFKTSNAQRYAL